MNKVSKAFYETNTDKGVHHGYGQWYDKIFENKEPTSLLEIGIKEGRSLMAWKTCFPACDITGIDIETKHIVKPFIDYAAAKVIIGDATKPGILPYLDEKYSVIIDDGSHFYKDIITTFYLLRDRFEYCYVIEDAMYRQDFVIKMIQRFGFHNIEVHKSNRCGVPVKNKTFLTRKPGHHNIPVVVDQDLIIVYRG